MSDIIKNTKRHRFHYLDGLRGLASLAVCLWHNFLAFFPGAVMSSAPQVDGFLTRGIYRSPLSIFFAGDFSVYIFFALSGFVISFKFFKEGDLEVLKKAFFRRYVRLMPPALVTVLASYVLLKFGWMFNRQAGAIADSWWLNLNWSAVHAGLADALHYGLYGLWFVGRPPQASYNSNLGTLLVEILGSYVVYLTIFISLAGGLALRWRYPLHGFLIVLAFALFPGDPVYCVFFIGMALADLYQNTPEFYTRLRRFGIPLMILGVFLGGMNIGNITMGPYRVVAHVCRALALHPLSYPWALGAVSLVLGVILVPKAQRLLEKRFFQILGEYSFALYVTHTVLLGSLTCYLFQRFSAVSTLGYGERVFLSFMLALPVLLLATHLVKKVDDLAISLARRI